MTEGGRLMAALASLIEELSERMEDGGDGAEFGQGTLLRSLIGSRIRQEYRREHREEMLERLFTLPGTVWLDLLSEKVKNEIEKTQGDQLNKIARVIAA